MKPLESRSRLLVLGALAATLAASAVAAFLVIERFHRHVTQDAAFQALRGSARMYAEFERADTEKLSAALQGLLADEELQRGFAARDREALLKHAAPVLEQMRLSGVTHWYFITPERTVFLRVHEPAMRGDRVDRVTMQRAAISGTISSGKELGLTAFALRVVSPWRDGEGRLLGYMELGEDIDHFLTRIKEATGDDVGLVIKKEFLDEKAWVEVLRGARNTWDDRPDVVLVDTTSFAQGIADFGGRIDDVPLDGRMLEERLEDGRAWLRGVFPVQDVSGRRVGALFMLHDFTAEHRAFAAGRVRGVFVVLAICVAGLLVCAWLLERYVFRPAAAFRHGTSPGAPSHSEEATFRGKDGARG